MEQQNNIAIRAVNVSKTFSFNEDEHNTIKSRLFNFFKPVKKKRLQAVKPLSLEIHKGECVGLIGRNGSGKSTLIKMLCGLYPVDKGTIEMNGTTMLMNLGLGMSHELTARENIYISGSILGLTIKQVDELFDQIVDFAELREFVNTKIKFFSSGMMAKLAFSIAVNAGAEIMFLDEVFAVGDIKFKKNAVTVLENSWLSGRTVILVSHTMDIIQKYCKRTIYLKNGELIFFGDTEKAIELYTSDNL